jgi:hypothetical protein
VGGNGATDADGFQALLTGARPNEGHTASMAAAVASAEERPPTPSLAGARPDEGHTASLAAPAAASASAVAVGSTAEPPTMLQRRDWQRGAQRALRLALTATRAAWTDFQVSSRLAVGWQLVGSWLAVGWQLVGSW